MLYDLKAYSALMAKCSNCAFCEATCPVFLADLLETHLARARMMLINRSLVDQSTELSSRTREIINRCLVCSNCARTCPAGVPVDEIVVAARYRIYKGKRMNLAKRILLKQIMENRGLKGVLRKIDAMAKMVGLSPGEIPKLPRRSFCEIYTQQNFPVKDKPRGKVAYFVGCATNSIYPEVGAAVMQILAKNRIEVTLPENIVCCGIPALVEGDLDTAKKMMETNIKALSTLNLDAIVTDCTSCGLTLKKKMLKVISFDHPLYEKAQTLASKIRDVTDYLNQIGLKASPGKMSLSYTYHAPCHGAWSPSLVDSPRNLLARIPGVKLLEMQEPETCCGAGGTFFMDHRDLSTRIRRSKIKDIQQTGADMVITSCPSCRSYLNFGLSGSQTVCHPMVLLAESYGSRQIRSMFE